MAKWFHGSKHKLTSLRAGSYVTPHAGDAAVFGVPWDSSHLEDKGGADGRPPQALVFKKDAPEYKDHPVYIYEVVGQVERAKTNKGGDYEWNHKLTKETPVRLVKTIPSWKAEFTKTAMAIHVLTGRMGAGKSTRAKKMGYDVVIGTDTGKISGGKYERPADVNKVRQAKLQRALTADARGKKVLIEGHPNGVERIFGPHVGRISKVMEIDTKPSVAMGRVKSRAAKRGSSVVNDVRAAKFYNRLYGKSLDAISQGGKLLKKIGSVDRYYHGTSPEMEARILKEGLRASKGGSGPIFTTGSSDDWRDKYLSEVKGNVTLSRSPWESKVYGMMADPEFQQIAENKEKMTGSETVARKALHILQGMAQTVKSYARYKPLEVDPAGIRTFHKDPSGIVAIQVPHDIHPKYITKGGTVKISMKAFSDELQKIAATPKDDANALFGLPLTVKRRPGTRRYETEGSGAAASPDRSTSPVTGQSTANVAGSNTITPATGPGGV